jgi:hypothetical protein
MYVNSQLPPNFDWKFYLDYYPDLRDAGLKTPQQAAQHYVEFGKKENRIFYNPINDLFETIKDKSLVDFKGVNIFGYGNTISGLGHNMRMIISALELVEIPYNLHIIQTNQKQENFFTSSPNKDYDINLILMNPDTDIYFNLEDLIKNKYNIALWAWELDKLPNKWKERSKIFAEIWTISDFCFEVFKSELPNQIIKKIEIPANFKEIRDKNLSKEKFNLVNKFVVLFVFDTSSDLYRKNPFDLISVFVNSISKYDNTILILKTHNLDNNTKYFYNLPPNIWLINQTWDDNKMTDLFNAADLYVSLHRSEGSGLTLMEAIDLEIPIICTNYSGNLDFCDENCLLVDYELIPLKDSINPTYNEMKENCKWAKIDINDAIKKMNDCYENYDFYKTQIKKTKTKMLTTFNINSLSKKLKEYLV